MWGSDVDSIMQAFGSVGSTWESHAQQQRIPQEGPTGDCVTRHVPEGGVCKASSNDTNQHACLLPYINCARGLEFMERDTPTRGAETVHGDVSCRVSAVVSADAIRALSLEERGASESTCIASDALTMASGVPGDLNVTPHASDVEACITDVMVPTSHIPNDMKEDHRDPVDVGTGRSDGGNGPPVSHGKRVHHCYKCGVTGHHPAMCQVDVRYMMCGVHGRRRSEKNLYYDDVTGRYQCRTQFQCKTSGRRMGGVRNDPVRARNNGSSMPTPYVTHAVPPGLLTAQTTDVSSRNVDGNALVPVHRSLDGQTNGTMSGSIGGVPLNLGVAMVSPFPSCYTNGNIWPTPSIPFAVGNDGSVRALPMFIPPGNNFVSYDGREVRIPNGASITYVPGATSMTAPQPPR